MESKRLSLLSVFLSFLLCCTSIHATHVPGHYGFHPAFVPSVACSYPYISPSLAGMPIWSPHHAVSPFYGISPFAAGFYAPAFASQAVSGQLFNQLHSNQLFNQLQANQLFNQQQANQAFNQMEANQLFTQMQANQAFNQQQANQLYFLNQQLANYPLFPRGGCCPGSRAIFV